MNSDQYSTQEEEEDFFVWYLQENGDYDKEYEASGMQMSKDSFLKHIYSKMTQESKKRIRMMAAFKYFKEAGIEVPEYDPNSSYQVLKIEENLEKKVLVKNELDSKQVIVNDLLLPEQPKVQPQVPPQVQLQVPPQIILPFKQSNRKPLSKKLKDKSQPKNLLKPEDVQYETIYQFSFEAGQPLPAPPQFNQQEEIICQQPSQESSPVPELPIHASPQVLLQSHQQTYPGSEAKIS